MTLLINESPKSLVTNTLLASKPMPHNAATQNEESRWLVRYLEDQDACSMEKIIERFSGPMLSLAKSITRDHQLAEDSVQAAFLVFALKASTIKKRESVGSWLFGVVVRIAKKARAKNLREAERVQTHALSQVEGIEDNEPKWPDEDQSVLREELANLPDQYRLPLILTFWDGFTHQKASDVLGWSVWTFKDRLQRAKDYLRVRIARRGVSMSESAILAAIFAAVHSRAAEASIKQVAMERVHELATTASSSVSSFLQNHVDNSLMPYQLCKEYVQGELHVWIAIGVRSLAVASLVVASAMGFMMLQSTFNPQAAAQVGPEEDHVENGWRRVLLGRHQGSVQGAAVESESNMLYTVGESDQKLMVWNLNSMSLSKAKSMPYPVLWHVAVSKNGKYLAVLGGKPAEYAEVLIMDRAELRELGRIKAKSGAPAASVSFSANGEEIIVATNQLTSYDWRKGKVLLEFKPNETPEWITETCVSADGKYIAGNCRDAMEYGTACVWEFATGKLIRKQSFSDPLRTVVWSSTHSNKLVIGHGDTVCIWNIEDDKVETEWSVIQNQVKIDPMSAFGVVPLRLDHDVVVCVGKGRNNFELQFCDTASGNLTETLESSDSMFEVTPWGGNAFVATQWNGCVWCFEPFNR